MKTLTTKRFENISENISLCDHSMRLYSDLTFFLHTEIRRCFDWNAYAAQTVAKRPPHSDSELLKMGM